jgi:hypothetical protein
MPLRAAGLILDSTACASLQWPTKTRSVFLDPTDVVRGCHIIPAFTASKHYTDGWGLSPCASDSNNWQSYYVNRCELPTSPSYQFWPDDLLPVSLIMICSCSSIGDLPLDTRTLINSRPLMWGSSGLTLTRAHSPGTFLQEANSQNKLRILTTQPAQNTIQVSICTLMAPVIRILRAFSPNI